MEKQATPQNQEQTPYKPYVGSYRVNLAITKFMKNANGEKVENTTPLIENAADRCRVREYLDLTAQSIGKQLDINRTTNERIRLTAQLDAIVALTIAFVGIRELIEAGIIVEEKD